MESHHDLVSMIRMCSDWSGAEKWAGIWIVTDGSDPKGFMKLHLLLKWGFDLIHSFSGDKTGFFSCLMGIGWQKGNRFAAEFEMREGMSYHRTSGAAVRVYQSLLGTTKTCWHTTRSHPLIIRSVRMRISPRHTCTYTGRAARGASQNDLRGRLMDGPLSLPYGYPSCQHSLPLSCPLWAQCIQWWSRGLFLLMDGYRQEVRYV